MRWPALVIVGSALWLTGCPAPSSAPVWFSSSSHVTTIAGNEGKGYVDGPFKHAKFSEHLALAMSTAGDLFVVDQDNYCIRQLSSNGEVATFAGGKRGTRDGKGPAAEFSRPHSIVLSANGELYVGDEDSIRKVTPDGIVSTFAASNSFEVAFRDESDTHGLFSVSPIGVSTSGDVYALARSRNMTAAPKLFKVSPTGEITPWRRFPTSDWRWNGGKRAVVAPDGTLYLALVQSAFLWSVQSVIVRISPSGEERLLAGSNEGFADGSGPGSRFSLGVNLAMDRLGNVYVADNGNHRIRKVSPSGGVSTLAGSGDYHQTDGAAQQAGILAISDLAVDEQENVYFSEYSSIRRVSRD